MPRLHDYPASANCLKVRLAFSLTGRPHERVGVDIFAGETLTEEFGRLNPFRSTPVLELDDGRVLIESNAILVHVAGGTPLWPDDPTEQAEVVRWLIWEQTDAMPAIGGLRFRLLTGRLAAGDPDAVRRRAAGDEVLALLERTLAERPFLAGGRCTIADVAVYGYVHVAHEAGYPLAKYDAVTAWLARLEAQPGWVDDLAPYPPNARPGAGRSTYDGYAPTSSEKPPSTTIV
jgi:glutathione S-transferase